MSDHEPHNHSLDAELRSVPIPEGFMARLQRLARFSDEQLDTAMCDVPLPAGLLQRLQKIDRHQRTLVHQQPARQWALAAALFIAVGAALWGSLILMIGSSYSVARVGESPALDTLTMQVDSATADDNSGIPLQVATNSVAGAGPSPLEFQPINIALKPGIEDRDHTRQPSDSGRSLATSGVFGLAQFWPGASGKRRSEAMLMDMSLSGIEDVLADTRYDNLPDLHKVPGPIPRGIDLQKGDISQKLFLLQTGVFPFVDPQFQPVSAAPLVSGVASFELWRGYLEDGELPPSAKIRTEEFLAAIDYSFPRPTGQALALKTFASPSPWPADEAGRGMLQIAVQARDLPAVNRPPMHLTIAVDVSSSMRRGGRLEMVRRALSNLAGKLGPRDRVSLVAFHEQARVVVEDVGRADREHLRKAAASLEPEAATNLAAGLMVAYSTANSSYPLKGYNRRVMLVTDGLTQQDPGAMERLDRLLESGVEADLKLDCIDLSQDEELDSQLISLIGRSQGKLHRATDVEQIGWAFQETLSGRSQLVANDAKVTVTFNPKAVQLYRLLGHEPTPVAGLVPVRLETDFKSGQSAVAMYEFVLKANKEAEIASVKLEWRDPRDGSPRQVTQSVTGGQMPTSFHEASITLQWGTVAACTAEVLRDSPFRANLNEVIQLARQVGGQSREPGSFHEFAGLLERTEKAKPQRGNPRSSRSK